MLSVRRCDPGSVSTCARIFQECRRGGPSVLVSNGRGRRGHSAARRRDPAGQRAYLEPSDVAYPRKSDVDENYYRLACRILDEHNRRPETVLHIATHDSEADRSADRVCGQHKCFILCLRVRDAVWHPRAAATPARRGRRTASSAHFIRRTLVSVVHASTCRTAGRMCCSWPAACLRNKVKSGRPSEGGVPKYESAGAEHVARLSLLGA